MHQGIIIPRSARRQDLCSLHSEQQIESIWPHSILEGQEESVLELNRLDSHFLLVGILRSPVWISTMLIATNQIIECSWHFATIVTHIMKIHIMEVMNFCLHNRNLFREMLRRYWKRRLQNCLWCQEIQIQSTSWVWWTQFLYLNLPLLLSFCRLCLKSFLEFAATAQEWSRATCLWF